MAIGPDAALIGLIATFGFVALIAGANATAVIVFGFGVWLLWNGTKFVNAHIEIRKEKLALDRTRAERGQRILEQHPDRQKRLFAPREDKSDE